jgi:thiol-disulfide isomerase/thioredoxin
VIQGYIAAQSASVGDIGLKTIAIAVFYALGVAVPMLAIAYGGRAAASSLRVFRAHAREVRTALGVLIAACAFLIAFGVDKTLQQKIGDYTPSLQAAEKSCYAQRHLGYRCARTKSSLADYGRAPDFRGITDWFNSKPLTLSGLEGRGRVTLIDFWTYTCINCIRTLPYLEHWDQQYAHARAATREGRARGFLDVLVHQLSPDTSAPALVVGPLPPRRARDRRGPYAGVRVRGEAVERAPGGETAARLVAGRARPELRHLEGLPERVLAGRVSDRQDRTRS